MKHFLKSESGIALLLVLWVLMLLMVIVGEFCHAMRTEVNITRNFKEDTQSYYIAVAGLNRAVSELIKNEILPQKVKSPDSEDDDEEADEEEISWRINADIPAIAFGEGQFEVKIGNESGKVNINRANRRLLRMMLNGFDLDDSDKDVIVDSILDWRDKDRNHRISGAEDDYYDSLPEPYECKDGDFDSIEELLLVRGVTPEIFYGGLEHMVTVYQDETKSRGRRGRRGKGFDYDKVNVNTAPPQVLRSLPMMTDDLVQEIIEYRKEQDFKSMAALSDIVGPDVFQAIAKHITMETCAYYTIKSVGTLEGSQTKQGVEALIKIDTTLRKGYRVIKWLDALRYPVCRSDHR